MRSVMQMNNHKQRRVVNRLPVEMKELMKHINHECFVLAHHTGSMAWSVDFKINDTNLSLIYDRGSLTITKETGSTQKHLFPRDKEMFSTTMEDLANEVNNEFA